MLYFTVVLLSRIIGSFDTSLTRGRTKTEVTLITEDQLSQWSKEDHFSVNYFEGPYCRHGVRPSPPVRVPCVVDSGRKNYSFYNRRTLQRRPSEDYRIRGLDTVTGMDSCSLILFIKQTQN